MRVLVLCKRQYTGKDLLDDRYGRLFELPTELAARGHAVDAAVWSYRRRGECSFAAGGVHWSSVDALPSIGAYARLVSSLMADRPPDVVWASSDSVMVSLGVRLARASDIPVVIDLYDDYESFGLNKIPGMRRALRNACLNADALTTVSRTLAHTIRQRVPLAARDFVVENGVPPYFLEAIPSVEARLKLGLPISALLVGTAGALDASRGVSDLFDAVRYIRHSQPNVRLVVAGPRSRAMERQMSSDVIDLGPMPHAQIPTLYAALNVGVVCNRDTAFARACHPMKMVEMLACNLPVVAAGVGDAAVILGRGKQTLYVPGDHRQLATQIRRQLLNPERPNWRPATWAELAESLESVLQQAVAWRRLGRRAAMV